MRKLEGKKNTPTHTRLIIACTNLLMKGKLIKEKNRRKMKKEKRIKVDELLRKFTRFRLN